MPARGTFGLLLDPLLGPYFVGKLLSTTGGLGLQHGGRGRHVGLTGSALAVGCVRISQFAPQLLFAPLNGGTFLLVTGGPHGAFSVAVATNLVFAFIIVGLPIRGLVQRSPTGTHTVRRGLAHIRRDRPLALRLLTVLAIGLGADPMITPTLSAHLGDSAALVGALATASGSVAAMAYLAIAPLRRHGGDGQLTGFAPPPWHWVSSPPDWPPAAAVAVVAIGVAGIAAVVGALGVWAHVGGSEVHPPPVTP